MDRSLRTLAAFSISWLALAGTLAAQPAITGIQSDVLPRSGRIAIEGTGLGGGGEVLVAGLPAWTTTWTDERVVAYVPEGAPLGSASVKVVVNDEESNEVPLTVTARSSDGRVRWTFEADQDNLWYRPALAPDGTIYLHCSGGFVYALSADGALLWTQQVIWYPYAPPTAGPDGALYVGSIQSVYRISPSGEIEWRFDDPGAQGVQVAPKIGPDGRLYGAFDFGLGAVSLAAATGALEWSNPGDPQMWDYGNLGTETVFGRSGPGQPLDRFFVEMDGTVSLFGFTLDGEQLFGIGLANSDTHDPAVGADGTIYIPGFLGLNVVALDPDDGGILWLYDGDWATGISDIEIGPDDTLYFVGNLGLLEAFDPHSQSSRWRNDTLMILDRPTLTPDGSTLLMSGVPTYGLPGFVKAFDAASGDELWTVHLPGEAYPGFRVLGAHRPRITPDGSTAYVSTVTVSDPSGDPRSYLYALDLGGDPGALPCEDLRRMIGRCTGGRLTFGVALTDASHSGEVVTFDLDGIEQRQATISGNRALVRIPGMDGTGDHAITLVDPPACFAALAVRCD